MTGSDERNTQNATSVGKAAFPAPSAMKSLTPIGDSGMLYYDVETTRPIILTHIPLSET